MSYYALSDDHEPVPVPDVGAWIVWVAQHPEAAIVAQDFLTCGDARLGVSTIYLGVDFLTPHGPPRLWESQVFGTPLDGVMLRYVSLAAARAGHAQLLEQALAAYAADVYGVAV